LINYLKYLLATFLFLCTTFLCAQGEIVLVGQVLDKNDKQALCNASVCFENCEIGTTTNKEGFFLLRSNTPKSCLTVSMVGYKTKIIPLKSGESKGLEIELVEENQVLPDLLVFPGENPAIEFMKKVRDARKRNNPLLLVGYQPTVREKTAVAISHINRKLLNKKLFAQLQKGFLSAEDSSLFLPVYVSEESYLLLNREKMHVQSKEKSILLSENNNLKELANKLPVEANFYENYISLFGKNFLSPLAETAGFSYNYMITDSIDTYVHKEYTVVFRPKNKKDLAFEGSMNIDSASFALSNITANLSSTANINYVQKLGFKQEFIPFHKKWLFNKQQTVVNLQLATGKNNKVGSVFITRNSQYSFMNPEMANLLTIPTQAEDSFSKALDTLQHSKPIKALNGFVNMLINKYIRIGVLDIGPLNLLASHNKVEGNRYTLGARTGQKLSKYFTIGGYVGYGMYDEAWKYGGELQYRVKKADYAVLGIKYDNNMYQTDFDYHDQIRNENYVGNGLGDISSFILREYNINYNLRKKAEIFYDKQWHKGYNTHLALSSCRQFPNQYILFPLSNADPAGNSIAASYIDNYSLTLDFRFSYKERVMDQFFHRIYLSNYYPVTHFVFEAGNYQTKTSLNKSSSNTDSQGYYLKVHTSTKQTFLLGNFGKLRYTLDAGTMLGEVPYSLLETYSGYENNGLGRYAVHPLAANQFAADTYVTLHTSMVTNGILFNLIPLVNKLNLREILGMKLGYGSLQAKNQVNTYLPPSVQAFDKPYVQLSAGICNLFKVIALEYIWEFPQIKSPNANWGIQARLYVDF
jgi:hypothetical protein